MAAVIRAAAVVCLVCGCGGGASGVSNQTASHSHAVEKPAGGSSGTSAHGVARRRAANQQAVTLSVSSEAGVDHQVQMLRKSIALYEQFIDRAAGQPEMKEAIQRSRERIEDAEQTIRFLLQGAPPQP
jgi:hypothetical protein